MALTSEDLVALNQLMAQNMQAMFSSLRPQSADPLAYGPGTLTSNSDNSIGLLGGLAAQILGLTYKSGPYAGTPLFKTSFRMQPYGQNSTFEESLMRSNAAMYRNVAGSLTQGGLSGFNRLFERGSALHNFVNTRDANGNFVFSSGVRGGLDAFGGFLKNSSWGQMFSQLGYGAMQSALGYDRAAISQVAWQRANYMAANQPSIGGGMFSRNASGRLVYNNMNPYDEAAAAQRTTLASSVSRAVDAAMYGGHYVRDENGYYVRKYDENGVARRIYRTSMVQDKSVTNGLDDVTVAKIGTRMAAAGAFGDLGEFSTRMTRLTDSRDKILKEMESEKANIANLEQQFHDNTDPERGKELYNKLEERRKALQQANTNVERIQRQIDTEQERLNDRVKTNLAHVTRAVDSLRTVFGSADKAMSALDRYTGGAAFNDVSVAQRFTRQMHEVDIAGFQAGVAPEMQQNIMDAVHSGSVGGLRLSARDEALGYGNTRLSGYFSAAMTRNIVAAMGGENDPTRRTQIAAAGAMFAETFSNSDMRRVLVQLETGLADGSISAADADEIRRGLTSGDSQLRARAQRRLYARMYNGNISRGFRDLRNSSVMLRMENNLSESALANITETGLQSRLNQNAAEFQRSRDTLAMQDAKERLRGAGVRGRAVRGIEARGRYEGAMAALSGMTSSNAMQAASLLQSAYQKNLERFGGDVDKAMAATMRDYDRMGIADMLSDEEKRAVQHGISSGAASRLSAYADETVLSGFVGSASEGELISTLSGAGAMRNGGISRANAMRAGDVAFRKLRRMRKLSGIDGKTLTQARKAYRQAIESGDGAAAKGILDDLLSKVDPSVRGAVLAEIGNAGYGSGVGSRSSDEANAISMLAKNLGISGSVAEDALLYSERFGAGNGELNEENLTAEQRQAWEARKKLLSLPEQIVSYLQGNEDVDLADMLAANGDKEALQEAMKALFGLDKDGDIGAIARIANLNSMDLGNQTTKAALESEYDAFLDGRKNGAKGTSKGRAAYMDAVKEYTKAVSDYGAGSEEAIAAFAKIHNESVGTLTATRTDIKAQIKALGDSDDDKAKKETLKKQLADVESRLKTVDATKRQFDKSYGRVRDVDNGRGSGGDGNSDLVTTMEDVMSKIGDLIETLKTNRDGSGLGGGD